jgi:hypothetical protein
VVLNGFAVDWRFTARLQLAVPGFRKSVPYTYYGLAKILPGPDPVNWSGRRAIFSGILILKEDGCHATRENGSSVEDICRKMGVSEPSFYLCGRLSRCK